MVAGTLPEPAVRITRAVREGRPADALAESERRAPLGDLFARHGSLRVTAAAAEHLGLAAPACLPRPLLGLGVPDRAEVAGVVGWATGPEAPRRQWTGARPVRHPGTARPRWAPSEQIPERTPMTQDTPQKVGVIVGSTRPHRVGGDLAEAVRAAVAERPTAEVELIDLREVDLPFLSDPRPPKQGAYELESTKAWAARVDSFAGFVIVTPEYNASVPGVLKNALDTVWGEWNGKPAVIVSYGSHGGKTAAQHLADVLPRLKMDVVEPMVHIAILEAPRDDDGRLADPAGLVGAHQDELDAAVAALESGL